MNVSTPAGLWLKQRRKALDLTQDELARRVGYAVSTIRKIEAGVLRPSRQMAERLADQLELTGEEQAAFVRALRSQSHKQQVQPPDSSPPDTSAHDQFLMNLPAPATPLIGRDQDVMALRAQLLYTDVRLVTVIGPAGIGKTRLSL